jgi:hypothetical protein
VLESMKVFGNHRRMFLVVWKELCYGKAETLEDAEEAARWCRYNLSMIKKCAELLRHRMMWRGCYNME